MPQKISLAGEVTIITIPGVSDRNIKAKAEISEFINQIIGAEFHE